MPRLSAASKEHRSVALARSLRGLEANYSELNTGQFVHFRARDTRCETLTERTWTVRVFRSRTVGRTSCRGVLARG